MPAPATKKIRALLVYLALQRRTDVPRERLIETFWPDAEPDRARDSLKTALSSIRRSLAASGADPDAVLETSKSTVRWTAETSVDAEEFLALAAGAGEDARRNALQLYAGDFLDDDFQEWAVAERERIADAYEHLLIRLLRDDPDPELARRLLARNPFHEEAYAALIDAELLAGRSIAAAGHVERCRAALAELGASPSESFERRYGALRRPAAAELDVEFRLPFIGRDAAFATLRGAFADAARGTGSIVLVYGEPGIGKSSFLDRAAPLAATLGLRMITARGVQDDPRAFGTWRSIAEELTGHPLADVVRDAADPASAIVESVLGALHGPAVFFVDDVHWLHGDSLKATIALARTAAAAHVVLLSLRSEALTPVLAGLGDLPAIHVPLGYIGADETFAALRELIDAPPDLFLRNLYDRTKGHPLFLRSLLDSLVQSAALKRVGGVWKVLSADTKLALPPDLKRTIEARIRSAGDAATQVACALAVEPDARICATCSSWTRIPCWRRSTD
jgi:DNA-binding SARP family transcriptional activator